MNEKVIYRGALCQKSLKTLVQGLIQLECIKGTLLCVLTPVSLAYHHTTSLGTNVMTPRWSRRPLGLKLWAEARLWVIAHFYGSLHCFLSFIFSVLNFF